MMLNHVHASMVMAAGWVVALMLSGCGGGGGGVSSSPPTIRFSELWSEQFPSVRFNGFTKDTTFAGNQSELRKYLFVGAQSGSKGAVSVHLEITGDASDVVLRFAHVNSTGGITLIGRTWKYAGGPTTIEIDPNNELPAGVSAEDAIELTVVAGVDYDKNGAIEVGTPKTEVLQVSPWRIRLVSQLRYNAEILLLPPALKAGQLLGSRFAIPFALSFLDLNGLQQVEGVAPSVTSFNSLKLKWDQVLGQYESTDPLVFDPNAERSPLSHHVGVDYRSGKTGEVGAYRFSKTSALANSIRGSQTFRNQLLRPALEALAAMGSEAPSVHAYSRKVALRFSDSLDSERDLFGSFGTAYYSISVTATVSCTPTGRRLNGVILTGELFDIYDWNFDTPGGPFRLDERMASVQAGFGTLGSAGKVFSVEVDLGADLLEYDGIEFGGACGQCASVAGSGWIVTGSATRLCDGSLSSQSFTNQESGTRSATLYQNGCLVNEIPRFDDRNTFTIIGNTIGKSGPMFFAEDFPAGTIFSTNQINTRGIMDPSLRRINFMTSGFAEATIGGVRGSCSFSSNIVFNR